MITLWCRLNLDPFGTLGRVIVVEDWAEIRRLYSGVGWGVGVVGKRGWGGVAVGSAAGVSGAAWGVAGGRVRAADPGVVGGVPADAGDGDRGAGGLAAFRVDLPRAGVGAATGVSGCRPGAEDLVSAGRDRAV